MLLSAIGTGSFVFFSSSDVAFALPVSAFDGTSVSALAGDSPSAFASVSALA
ncbi:hypothetical protein PF011_g32529 [Phytophthora fragariae]|uniref:Uncharacterized protein n=1 Tax=Phytophthora fragariae TaxID=53985 RepID=A0A6A3G819_9STRA|nr:hypothetical protein PF011_g32529 [Phytophthora fragariae]